MADALVERLRPLGFEKYASRLTRIVGDAMQVVVGGDQVRKNLMPAAALGIGIGAAGYFC